MWFHALWFHADSFSRHGRYQRHTFLRAQSSLQRPRGRRHGVVLPRGIIPVMLSGVLSLLAATPQAAEGDSADVAASVERAASAENAEQVNRVLKRMSTAVRELNYRGLFTYEVGGSLDTYKIIHRVDGGTEYERLIRLNGPRHEVLRSGQAIDCLSRGDQLLRGVLPTSLIASDLRDYYNFYLTGDERVAGRRAMVLQVVPKDEHRFGYTLGLDAESGLPLKTMRVGENKRVMERIQFVQLSVVDGIAPEEVTPAGENHRRAAHDLADCRSQPVAERPSWQMNWLPAGFVYSGQRQVANGDQVLTYTDGLATFSVFIGRVNAPLAIEGRAQMGATVAYVNQRVWNRQPHSVTVVGEIPFATAQRVVAALEPREP